ncbi:MAG: hypothetical protein HKO62_01720 [Gammaproteobacteria bacterium]|nr:hypothetical protein [Gammaproteobacteria bacterium]
MIALQHCTMVSAATIAFIGERSGSGFRGAELGVIEANYQGEFLGRSYTLTDSVQSDTAFIATTLTGAALDELADRYPSYAVMNIQDRADARRDACRRNLFSVIPSDTMYRDAQRQWQRKQPDVRAEARAWESTMRKYSATQLNTRYREHAGRPMDDEAWAGWAAIKVATDQLAGGAVATPDELIDALRKPISFDGIKGVSQSFRPNGQMRQRLLLVAGNGKIVAEAPIAGVVDGNDLDTLGRAHCGK